MSEARTTEVRPGRRDLLTGRWAPAGGAPNAMRRPDRAEPDAKGLGEPTPPIAVIALNRMGFGPRPGDIAAFLALGASGGERLQAYVEQQLDPMSIDDTEADNQIAALGFTTLNKTRTQLWNDHRVNPVDSAERRQPREEVLRATFLRAIFSKRQLLEVLADFWHNHFNVDAGDFFAQSMWSHYDREVIRAHVFGNFREMLETMAMSNSMLYYLDNYTSSNAGPNENFCRELFELHTMGSENYLGVIQQNEVPPDNTGAPSGYVDADVFEATRAFTGWTLSNSTSDPDVGNSGEFFYRAEWHDRFQKNVLGVFLPQDQEPLKDGRDVLDALAAHPGTGRFIARKLCRRLIADNPPQAVVDAAAAVFTANVAAPDQLKQVVRTILLSDEFRTTWGEKTKRPFEFTVGAMRATEGTFPFAIDDGDSNSFFSRYNQAGQSLFRHRAPDGYPDKKSAWQSTTPRAMGWRLVNWMIDERDADSNFYLDVLSETPGSLETATEIADYWINRILARPMTPEDRQTVIDFLAQGFNPDFALPWDTNSDIRERIRSMVGLIFMSPSFLSR